MIQLRENCPFHPGPHQLRVVITDLAESEAMIRQMAEDAQRAHPEDFAGKSPCVYYKMPYVPPYETFRELRQLILCIRESTGLRAHFQGVVAIEVTEWLGHESEDYFTVFLKYLYDHRELWQATLVLNSGTAAQTRQFLSACAVYITPRIFDACLFSQPERLRDAICRECGRIGKIITRDAVEMLAEALSCPEFRHARGLLLIQRAVEELGIYFHSNGSITENTVQKYLEDPCSTLTMIAGKTLSNERSKTNGAELLQL